MDKETIEALRLIAKEISSSNAEPIRELATLMKGLQQQKAITLPPDAQLIFGPGGIFSNFGLEDLVINANIAPIGMDRVIPAFNTVELAPIYPFITGFEDDGTSEPDGVCDDAPGGVIETCHQTAQFGRFSRQSKTMEANELMQVVNGKITQDLRVLGEVLGEGHRFMPQAAQQPANWINHVVLTQMTIVGILIQRLLNQRFWQGNPVNNSAGGGYKEFPGMDILISTGKIDAFTSVACPALDSDIKDFNFNDIYTGTPDIVEYVSMMEFYLRHVASRNGLLPVDWIIAMRPQLFFELTSVWPCRYLSYRCGDAAGAQINVINDTNNVSMRDEMRNGNFLWVNGRRMPVVLDDGIFEETNTTNANLEAGQFASDIYFIPLRARNIPVLYWEYLDYSQIAPAELAVLNNRQRFWSSDGGRWMWAVQDTNWCFKIQGKIEPRVVLRTPQLAGRIQNVTYTPLQHLRSPFQDSDYFAKGGAETFATAPSFWSEWNTP